MKSRSSLAAIAAVLLLSACPNQLMRDLVEQKLASPTADTFYVNDGATPTASLSVTLHAKVAKSNDALQMRFRNEGGAWTEWQPYAEIFPWSIPIGDGAKTVYAEFRDEGHHVVAMSGSITLDTGAPVGPGFYAWGTGIAAGQQHNWINSSSTTLMMNVAGANRMRFSNSAVANSPAAWDSSGAAMLSYASSAAWSLAPGDGAKTVYAQFLDAADNPSYFTYAITLDTAAPTAAGFLINGGAATASNTSASLGYSYADANTVYAQYMNDGESWSSYDTLAGSPAAKSWTLRPATGVRTVWLRLTDIAGNVSAAYSDTITLSTSAPAAPSVTAATPTSDATPTWSWSAVGGATQYQIKLDSAALWTNIGSVLNWTPGSALGNGSHLLEVQAGDLANNWSFTGSFTVTVDTSAPAAPSGLDLAAADDSGVSGSDNITNVSSALTVSGSAEAGSSVELVETTAGGTVLQSLGTATTGGGGAFSLDVALAEGTRYVRARAIDAAGNVSSDSAALSLVVDTTAPSLSSFRLNNYNTNAASPVVRIDYTVTDNYSSSANLRMRFVGAADSGMLPFAAQYAAAASGGGSVTGYFTDQAGNQASASDGLTVRTSAGDIRYENQSLPSHEGTAAFDLGLATDWDLYGGDYAAGDTTTNYSGNATLWDEDWFVLDLDIGYSPSFTISSTATLLGKVKVEAFYDAAGTVPVPVLDYQVTAFNISIQLDWSMGTDGELPIWIKISKDPAEADYSGIDYQLEWNISIL